MSDADTIAQTQPTPPEIHIESDNALKVSDPVEEQIPKEIDEELSHLLRPYLPPKRNSKRWKRSICEWLHQHNCGLVLLGVFVSSASFLVLGGAIALNIFVLPAIAFFLLSIGTVVAAVFAHEA